MVVEHLTQNTSRQEMCQYSTSSSCELLLPIVVSVSRPIVSDLCYVLRSLLFGDPP